MRTGAGVTLATNLGECGAPSRRPIGQCETTGESPTVPRILRAALLLRAKGASLLAMGVLLYWINGTNWILRP